MDDRIESYQGGGGGDVFDLAKLQELVYSLNFETEIARASIEENDIEVEEYERRTELLEKEIEYVIAETKRCEEEAKSYADRSARGLEAIEKVKCIQMSLADQRRRTQDDVVKFQIESNKQIDQMKKVVEDYQTKYDEFLSGFQSVHGFEKFASVQEEFEKQLEQQQAEQAESAAEKEKRAAFKQEAEETWGRIKENIIAAAQAYHDHQERLRKEENILAEEKKKRIEEERRLKEASSEKHEENLESVYFAKHEQQAFKKPESNSSITITRMEKPAVVDLKEMLKLDTLFPKKQVSSKGRAESVISTTSTVGSVASGFEKLKSSSEATIPRISSVESFQQFNKKLKQKEHQTSSPMPQIPDFLVNVSLPSKKEEKQLTAAVKSTEASAKQTFEMFNKMSTITNSLEKLHTKLSIPIPAASSKKLEAPSSTWQSKTTSSNNPGFLSSLKLFESSNAVKTTNPSVLFATASNANANERVDSSRKTINTNENVDSKLFGTVAKNEKPAADVSTNFDFSINKRNDDFFNLFSNETTARDMNNNNNNNNNAKFTFNLNDTASTSGKTDTNQFQQKLNFF